MSGIIGAFNLKANNKLPLAEVRAGMETMRARGPDAAHLYQNHNIALGHRRLALIDLNSGAQPMTDPDTGITGALTGGLYNFRTVRQILRLLCLAA